MLCKDKHNYYYMYNYNTKNFKFVDIRLATYL